jgi:hypothetical protein
LPTSYRDAAYEELPIPSLLECIRLCSIQTRKPVTDMTMPEWYDEFYFTGVSDTTLRDKRKFHAINTEAYEEDASGLKRHKVIDQKTNKSLAGDVQRIIRKMLPEPYRDLVVSGLLKCKSENGSHYYLVRTNHTYCMNKVDYHSSNTIYFVVNPYGLYQKCFCRCPVNRKNGTCEKYKSNAYPINDALKAKMFPSYMPVSNDPLTHLERMMALLDEKIANDDYQ